MQQEQQLRLELAEVSKKLDAVLARLSQIEKGTDVMVEHVSFVMSVYNTVKLPFFFLMNYTSKFLIEDNKQQRIDDRRLTTGG
jgi:hypothetical protein